MFPTDAVSSHVDPASLVELGVEDTVPISLSRISEGLSSDLPSLGSELMSKYVLVKVRMCKVDVKH